MVEKESSWSKEQTAATKNRFMAALEQVIDLELGIDIVNLGLVYEAELLTSLCCDNDVNNEKMSFG